jgi:putative membrane protein
MATIVGIIITLVIAGFVIWIVGKLGLGMTVSGFGAAFISAAVIAIVSWVVWWLLGLLGISVGGGWLGAIIALIIAAIILLISDRFVPGMRVDGFIGAIVAAIAIGVVTWIVDWVLGLLGL